MGLFKDGILRKPDKPAVRKIIMPDEASVSKESIKKVGGIVVDGGALLHRVRWDKGMTFNVIASKYLQYVKGKYGPSAVVVFDGYEDEGFKSHEHQRRSQIPQCCYVDIDPENNIPFNQSRYLSIWRINQPLSNFCLRI